MSASTYNTIAAALAIGAALAFAISLASLIAMIVGWRGPHRKRRAIRCVFFLALIPTFIAAQQFLQWGIFMPSLRAATELEVAEVRTEQLRATSNVHVGDAAPPFVLLDADGDNFSLDDMHGKVVLINFFATWCGPCLSELPHIQKLWDEYGRNENFELLVIGREESMKSVTAFRSQNGYTFPIAADPDRDVYSLYAKESIPRTLLIAADGRIVFSTVGFYEEELERLEQALSRELGAMR